MGKGWMIQNEQGQWEKRKKINTTKFTETRKKIKSFLNEPKPKQKKAKPLKGTSVAPKKMIQQHGHYFGFFR